MSEISSFLPQANPENVTNLNPEEQPPAKEIEKKKKKSPQTVSNKMPNNLNSKKIDTTLYKKIFFSNFKEVCSDLFPQNKNFSNEKYQNFKAIYHKIYFYKRSCPDRFNELLDEYISTNKKATEIKKINHKNSLIKLLIQKIESQQNKLASKQIFEEIGRDMKADFIEKIYDSLDISEIKDSDKDKTLDNFLQRTQAKPPTTKKRTRKQLDKVLSSSPEKIENDTKSQNSVKKNPIKKQKYHAKSKPVSEDANNLIQVKAKEEPEKLKSMFEFEMDNAQNSSFMTFQNSVKTGQDKNLDLFQLHFDNASVTSDILKTNNANFLEGCLSNDIVVENLDPHETNLIKIANRNILSKLNKFCSYDFTQTNALIPHICVPNEKKQHHSSMTSQKQNPPFMAQEFLKKVNNLSPLEGNHSFTSRQLNECEDINSKHNFNSLSDENNAANVMNYPPNNFANFYNETPNQYMGHENYMANNYQPIPNISLKIEKPISFQESLHGSHHNSHSSQKIKLNPMDFSYLQSEDNIKIEQQRDRKEKHTEHKQQHREHKEYKEQKVQRNQKIQKDLKEEHRELRARELKEKEIRDFKELKELQEQKEKELKELKELKEMKDRKELKEQREQSEKEYAYLKGQKDHKTSHSKHPNVSHKEKKVAKSRAKKNVEKKTHLSSHETQNIKPMMQQPNSNFERSERNEKREPSLLSKGMSFSGNPGINKGEPLPAYPHQQYFSIVPLEKDMQQQQQTNRRSVQIPQIYQAQPSYRPNSNYFYGPPQENNYINNNVISNNFCFQTGNPNHFVGVNYPNVQNITFTKPNGYPPAAYGVMELNNNDNFNNQYALNNMNDRSYGEKHRSADYWKSSYYPYNSQN